MTVGMQDSHRKPTVTILLVSAEAKAIVAVAARRFGEPEIRLLFPDVGRAVAGGRLLRTLRDVEAEVFVIAVRDLRSPDLPVVMRALLRGLALLPRARSRMFLDERGAVLRVSVLQFLVTDLPLLAVGVLASMMLVLISYLILLPWRVLFWRRPRPVGARP